MTAVPAVPTEPQTAMTVGRLRELLAKLPTDAEVLVQADDVDGQSVFAALKGVEYEWACNETNVVRLYADDTEDAAS